MALLVGSLHVTHTRLQTNHTQHTRCAPTTQHTGYNQNTQHTRCTQIMQHTGCIQAHSTQAATKHTAHRLHSKHSSHKVYSNHATHRMYQSTQHTGCTCTQSTQYTGYTQNTPVSTQAAIKTLSMQGVLKSHSTQAASYQSTQHPGRIKARST